MRGRFASALSLATLVVAGTLPSDAVTAAYYEGGGTVAVAKINGVTVVDNGAAICRPGGSSTGGACVPFAEVGSDGRGGNVYLGVTDETYGKEVAFQVCIDNNGDGVCGGPDGVGTARCGDDQFFSHDEDGRFFNPLGPLPNTFRQGCPGSAAHAGYVVFLCTGVHSSDATGPHAHQADAGFAATVTKDDATPAYGTFCGGSNGGVPIPVNGAVLQAKPYTLE